MPCIVVKSFSEAGGVVVKAGSEAVRIKREAVRIIRMDTRLSQSYRQFIYLYYSIAR